MEYIALIIAGSLVGAVAVKFVDKAAMKIAVRFALRDWNKVVMRNFKRQRRERWKRETMSVALDFKKNERALPPHK